jgi:hypothetical protein
MFFRPDQSPWPVFPREFSADLVCSIMTGDSGSKVIRVADVEMPLWILKDVNPEHGIGSRGRIRTYDGTLPLSYDFDPSNRSRINRADFQFLISRSRRIALERSGCSSDEAKVQGPFFRVNFPLILSVRL